MGFIINSKGNTVFTCFIAKTMFNRNYFYNIKNISENKDKFIF